MIMTRKSLWLLICSALLVFIGCQKAPQLTITSPPTVDLSVDGSRGTITFIANRNWTISTSDSWISISPKSGEASKDPVSVTVSCNANTTYEDRTATVTIRMEELTQTVTIKQPANLGIILPTRSYNLESGSNSFNVEVQANVPYSVSSSVDWIKQTGTKALTSTTYVFSVEENASYDDREGTVTIKSQNSSVPDQVITVRQAQKDALIVKDKSFDMPYGGGEIEFKVEANIDFDVTPREDWIHHVETKAMSSSTVRLTIDENPTYSKREGKIEIKQKNGSLPHTITVKQAERIAVTSITLDQISLTLKPEETATLVATVKPDDATEKTINWSSTDETIASVNQNGLVKALKEGTATIIAKAGNKEASCAVTVQQDSSNDPIVFADTIAKYACLEKFDANKDGEVSYAEAAAVTSLRGLFTNWDTVTSFEEIKYFTGVTSTYGVFSNLKNLKSISIPDNITRLGDFSGCINLETVTLPQKLASLPTECFMNCTSLKNVILPSSITAIPKHCFQCCSALESIELPESIVSIGDYAFSSCHLLSNINIPPRLYSIGQRSFEYCPGISSLVFPESLSQLGNYSFDGCTSLATVSFHGPMQAIPEGAFNGCKSLSFVSWPENLISIGDYAFFSCPLTDGNDHSVISIPESVTSIGRFCFSLIQHILLPSKQLVSISDLAFSFGAVLYVPQDLIEPYRQRTNWRNYIPFIYDTSSYPVDVTPHDYVDLGLSVQWASCDLGSSRPEQAGTAYQWYENDIVPGLTNSISRTPTRAECQELIDNCQWTAGWMFGVQGVLITSGKEGLERNWLFLPAGGSTGLNIYSERCYYWCLDKEQENGRHSVLYYESFGQVKDIGTVRIGTVCPIRPVKR